jgi:hypothetical protein
MRAHRLSIILLLGALWAAAARAGEAEPTTVARQDYTYDPRAKTVTLALTTVYSGRDADAFRLFYANAGQEGYRTAKLDYYRTMYDAVAEAAPPKVKDDRNAIETTEHYTVSLAEAEDDEPLHKFPIYPDLLRGFFSKLPPTIRQPYPLDAALDRRDIVTVTAPTLGSYELRGAEVSGRYFTFTRNARSLPGHVEMDYRLRFLASGVPVAEFEQYRADIEEMDHSIYSWIDLDRGLHRRYYRDIPTMIRGAGLVAVIVALATGIWWFAARKKPLSPRERDTEA